LINSIRLQHYRSYQDDSFEPDPAVNIIVGPNASGKTNLLESILVSAQGKSYRNSDEDLIRHQSEWGRVDIQLDDGSRILKLRRQNSKTNKQFVIGDTTLSRLSRQRFLPVVIFEPNNLAMLHGSPDGRREYFDTLLEKIQPNFLQQRRHYKRALAQRNALLKSGNASVDNVFVWDVRLSELGGSIAGARQKLLTSLAGDTQNAYTDIADSSVSLTFVYKTPCQVDGYSNDMLRRLKANFRSDVERGFTSIGPHRDDIEVRFDDYPAREVASRGEARTAILALKIQEAKLIEQAFGKKPVLLLDDVFSELDGSRRRHLTDFLQDYQAFITTTDADIVVQHFMQKCNIIPLSSTD